MAKIISICNQKGGVGKTTSAINISAALAHYSRRVLLVDMDPQGNASQGLGFDISLLSKCVLDVLNDGQNIKKVIKRTGVENLDLLPSKLKLASMDDFDSASNKYYILKDCLSLVEDDYDYIIIDCPPSFGFLTLNALVASNTVIIPVQDVLLLDSEFRMNEPGIINSVNWTFKLINFNKLLISIIILSVILFVVLVIGFVFSYVPIQFSKSKFVSISKTLNITINLYGINNFN